MEVWWIVIYTIWNPKYEMIVFIVVCHSDLYMHKYSLNDLLSSIGMLYDEQFRLVLKLCIWR